MNVDFKKFKKTKEDEKTATLKHPDGHEIKVAKGGLSKSMMEQLKNLPMHFDEGGDVPEENASSMPKDNFADVQGLVDQGADQAEIANQTGSMDSPVVTSPFTGERSLRTQSPEMPAQPQAAQPKNVSIAPAAANRAPSQATDFTQAQMGGYQKAFGQEERGIKEQQAAEQNLAKSQATAAEANQKSINDMMANHQQALQHLNSEITSTMNDIKEGHIDPNHYVNSLSTAGKISSAIGLILGGMGGALTHQENPALKYMQSQIDNDVKAQQINMNNKQNVLNGYFKQTGDLNEATALTKAFYTELYSNDLRKAAAQSGSPIAKANADKALGQLEMQKQQALAPIAMKAAALNHINSGGDPGAAIPYLFPDKTEAAKAQKELTDLQNMQVSAKNALAGWDEYNKLNTPLNKLNPQAQSKMAAFRDPMLMSLSRASAGRFNMDEMPVMGKLYSNATDTDSTRAMKRQEFINHITEKGRSSLLESKGVKVPFVFATPAKYR